MNRYAVEQKFKSFAAFLVILILLPYIVSVFVNGADFREKDETVFYVKVRVSESQEADGIAEVNWTDYLAGILALEVPEDYGEETMKAQAVLLVGGIDKTSDRFLREQVRIIGINIIPQKQIAVPAFGI